MDAETRRKEEQSILSFFYEKLQVFKKLVQEPTDVDSTFNQLEASYRKSLRYAVLPMLMTVVTNPHEDTVQNGETEGQLTRRLKFLLEDVFGK